MRATSHRATTIRAFTILEAVFALALLAALAAATLGMQAQYHAAHRRAQAMLNAEREAETLFQLVINRALHDPTRDEQSQTLIWTGTYLGLPYRIERVGVVKDNPLYSIGSTSSQRPDQTPVSPVVPLIEYQITYADTTTTAIWHR